MELSIVIPALNESNKIRLDIEAAAAFLQKEKLSGEIIVVDDGSQDTTAELAENTAPADGVSRQVIRLPRHRGKGYAIRTGINISRGRYVMFADSGLCIPYENALRGLELIKNGACDIAHGSRKLPQSIIKRSHYRHRRMASKVFRWLVVNLMGLPRQVTDSQCGFKIYRGEAARSLYSECKSDGFMFDVEIMLRAQRKGYKIREFPIEWNSDRDTRFRFLRASFASLVELLAIKITLAREKHTPPG